MPKLTKLVVNCETGVQEEIELTKEEIAQIEIDREIAQQKQAEAEAKAIAKAELLARLGITAEEAQLLLA